MMLQETQWSDAAPVSFGPRTTIPSFSGERLYVVSFPSVLYMAVPISLQVRGSAVD